MKTFIDPSVSGLGRSRRVPGSYLDHAIVDKRFKPLRNPPVRAIRADRSYQHVADSHCGAHKRRTRHDKVAPAEVMSFQLFFY